MATTFAFPQYLADPTTEVTYVLNRDRLLFLAVMVGGEACGTPVTSQDEFEAGKVLAAKIFDLVSAAPTSADALHTLQSACQGMDTRFYTAVSRLFHAALPWAVQPTGYRSVPVASSADSSEADGVCTVYKFERRELQRLLGRVLDVLAMSMPNKQQHEAAQHTVRKAFDEAHASALCATSSTTTVGESDGTGYALVPLR